MIKRFKDEDQSWLDAYQKALDEQYPGLVQEIIVFGSKARGDDRQYSDFDVFMVICEGDWRLKWELEGLACELSIGTNTIPTVMIFTEHEKKEMEEKQSSFYENVLDEGIKVS